MDTVFGVAIKYVSLVIMCSTRGLECFIILFLIRQYFKKKSNYKTTYYVILNIGYLYDLLLFITWLCPPFSILYFYIIILEEWFNVFFVTAWNVILCLNRCTALVYYYKYEKIWNNYTMILVIAIMLAFPFAADGIQLYNSNCTLETNAICYLYRKSYILKATIINGALMVLMVALIFGSMYYSRKILTASIKPLSIHAKTEHRLIHQAMFSTIFLFIALALKLASALTPDFNTLMFFSYLSNIVTHIHHLTVMLSHFWLSPSFKIAFLMFYRLKFLIPKKSRATATIVAAAVSRNFPISKVSSVKITA